VHTLLRAHLGRLHECVRPEEPDRCPDECRDVPGDRRVGDQLAEQVVCVQPRHLPDVAAVPSDGAGPLEHGLALQCDAGRRGAAAARVLLQALCVRTAAGRIEESSHEEVAVAFGGGRHLVRRVQVGHVASSRVFSGVVAGVV
jgi:hypothetical protein